MPFLVIKASRNACIATKVLFYKSGDPDFEARDTFQALSPCRFSQAIMLFAPPAQAFGKQT
jgi:hypothetical protein